MAINRFESVKFYYAVSTGTSIWLILVIPYFGNIISIILQMYLLKEYIFLVSDTYSSSKTLYCYQHFWKSIVDGDDNRGETNCLYLACLNILYLTHTTKKKVGNFRRLGGGQIYIHFSKKIFYSFYTTTTFLVFHIEDDDENRRRRK